MGKKCLGGIVMTKNNLVKVISVIVLILSLSTVAMAKQVELTFWNGFTGPDRVQVEGLVKEFNETHPDINIKNGNHALG